MVYKRRITPTLHGLIKPAALALALLTLAAPVAGQSVRYDGQPILEVSYVGLGGLPAETMDHYLFSRRRDADYPALDVDDLDARIKTLWERELIDDIDVEVEQAEGGVRLTIRLVERPILMSIDYAGLKRISRSDINEQMDRERISAYESQPLSRGELRRLKFAIEDLYKEKGYRFAEVAFSLEDAGSGQVRAIFTIDEGDKVKIGDIYFDGNTVFGDWRLRRSMQKTKESGLISRIGKKDIYNPANLDEDLESVRDVYRKAGYKDVLIAKPEIEVVAKNPDAPTIKQQKRRLAVTIPVEEGDRWRLGEIRVEGNEVFSEPILLRQFEEPRGGWLRAKAIDDGIEKIDKLYKSVGYIFAEIATEIEEVGDNVADLIVKVREQDQFRVGRLEFEGNIKTRDKVLRREMFLQEASVMNMSSVQNSLLRIRQLNYFALNEEEPIEFDFDAEEKTVDLKVVGEEAERTELQFGGGWSEIDRFFGQFAIRTTNFLGRGETLGVSIQAGGRRELYDLEYRIPWFLDKPQNVAVRLFSQDLDTRVLSDVQFRSRYSGASFTYGRSLRGFNNVNLTYSFTDVQQINRQFVDPALDTLDGEQDGIITADQQFKVASLQPYWARNTLDSRFEPSRGLNISGSVDIAGGLLGGDSDYVRPRLRLTWFKPVSRQPFKSSFAVNTDVGWIETYGGSQLFSQQRFYLGGESSIRGFRSRTVTAREIGDEDGDGKAREILRDRDGFPLGGERSLNLSLEYHLMLGGPFRVVFYADAGGVFTPAGLDIFLGTEQRLNDDGTPVLNDAGNPVFDPIFGQTVNQSMFDLDGYRYSVGAELRVQVPLFPAPLRFIYATNLEPLTDDRFNSFDFSLSTSF